MGTEWLVVDDVHRTYFECGKWMLDEQALEAPARPSFEAFLSAVNDGDPPPAASNRYKLSDDDAQRMFAFLEHAGWQVRVLGDGGEPHYDVLRTYEAVASLDASTVRAPCAHCGIERLLIGYKGSCAPCEWAEDPEEDAKIAARMAAWDARPRHCHRGDCKAGRGLCACACAGCAAVAACPHTETMVSFGSITPMFPGLRFDMGVGRATRADGTPYVGPVVRARAAGPDEPELEATHWSCESCLDCGMRVRQIA